MAPESIREPDKILPVSDVYSLGCTLYYAVTGKVPFPGGNTADKIRRHLDETPLNPLHFNPDLPEEFCDVIAAMMDKNPDRRTPTAAAVIELLRPWCDPAATKDLAGATPTSSSLYYRAARPPQPTPALDETASILLDENETAPGQIESPSQISQGTVSIAGETEDTLPHLSSPNRAGPRPIPMSEAASSRRWPRIVLWVAVAAVATVIIVVMATHSSGSNFKTAGDWLNLRRAPSPRWSRSKLCQSPSEAVLKLLLISRVVPQQAPHGPHGVAKADLLAVGIIAAVVRNRHFHDLVTAPSDFGRQLRLDPSDSLAP